MSADAIRADLAALRGAGERLRARSLRDTLDAVARVFDLFNDPRSQPRRALQDALPSESGFSSQVVAAGLEHGLGRWTYDAAIALFERELGPIELLESVAATRCFSGFPVTATILAGAIPMPTLLAMTAPLFLRSPVIAKPGSRDRTSAQVVRNAISAIDADLGASVALAQFGRDDEAALAALLEADCVVATGSDDSVQRIAAAAAPPRRVLRYGHRLSLAAVGRAALRGKGLVDAAEALSVDVALWDQLGCLSPVAVYVAGSAAEAAGVAEHLAAALSARERAWPRGTIDPAAAALTAHECSEAELRAAARGDVVLHGGGQARFTVVAEADATPRPAPLHRFVRVHSCGDASGVVDAITPFGPHLAAVGVAGFAEASQPLALRLAAIGASRICPLGTLQAPPLGWSHDNLGVLQPLARATDIELPATGMPLGD